MRLWALEFFFLRCFSMLEEVDQRFEEEVDQKDEQYKYNNARNEEGCHKGRRNCRRNQNSGQEVDCQSNDAQSQHQCQDV